MSFKVPEKYRDYLCHKEYRTKKGDSCGVFMIPFESNILRVLATNGEGITGTDKIEWEHVSVSLKNRTPNWKEMCFVKDLFWEDEDCVIQYHPPRSNYINNHPNVLHLWRPRQVKIPMPPSIFVGVK